MTITADELLHLSEEYQAKARMCPHTLRVCTALGCQSAGAETVKSTIEQKVKERGLQEQVTVKGVGCLGLCAAGPLVMQDSPEQPETLYQGVMPQHADEMLDALGKKPVERLQLSMDTPFFTRQKRIVLENAGVIDPESLPDYIAAGGYASMLKVVTQMTPAQVVDQVTQSGLRGRGGAGYPTGLKWGMVAKARPGQKYVICNGDEGDPGAFMDRSVMESDPHRVLEGMAIAAYAVGATDGYLYVRAEYPLAIKRLKLAIKAAEKQGLLGKGIGGTDFSFHVEVRLGAGAFVCGEETALIASIEGNRGTPRPRPPYPANSGLWGCPTLINNVETFASIAPILRNGAEWYAAIGTEKSKGTKVFALAGKINNTGLVEVPMGITLREIVYDIGGGVPEGHTFKAVQTGGPSGGCIPAELLDLPVDYDSLGKAGSIMGSGGMIVMDDTSNMADVAKYFMEFCMTESCGKCVPCRVGTVHMHALLEKIVSGAATPDDVQLLERLADVVRNTSLCGLGQTAPNPVLSTLRYFRNEYEALLKRPREQGAMHSEDGRHALAEVK
jgi:bidirectional [NiFe] hydrogenase diaphorase subunit